MHFVKVGPDELSLVGKLDGERDVGRSHRVKWKGGFHGLDLADDIAVTVQMVPDSGSRSVFEAFQHAVAVHIVVGDGDVA